MCVVSMVGDHYTDKWKDWQFGIKNEQPQDATAFQLEQLRAEVQEMKALLKRALEYDKRNNEPHCETAEKMDTLRKVAALVGVDLDAELGIHAGEKCSSSK